MCLLAKVCAVPFMLHIVVTSHGIANGGEKMKTGLQVREGNLSESQLPGLSVLLMKPKLQGFTYINLSFKFCHFPPSFTREKSFHPFCSSLFVSSYFSLT